MILFPAVDKVYQCEMDASLQCDVSYTIVREELTARSHWRNYVDVKITMHASGENLHSMPNTGTADRLFRK